ncbi:alcohol dehydrogenase [Exophiala viscosa]|uniref:alcohol dehydrogenase n=1 Tax=Exophiala viscosa TaxID=2486360 RepID=A0AAN6IA30_9EURO|nr:alcohol dehydrogenase [Exophiala viscosa]
MDIPEDHKVAILVRHDGTYHFETKTVPVPEIAPTDLLVRLSVTGICGSDFHLAAGHSGPTRDILGHEGIGRVVKLGSAISASFIDIGSRVGIAWVRDLCEKCFCCLAPGGEARCLEMLCSGLKRDGTFAEYAVVPSRYVVRIPEGVPDQLVAPILCGGVTAFKAIKVSEAAPGQWMVISGAGGGVGALGIQFAKAMGYRVIAIDLGDAKREYCLELGAEEYFDATKVDASAIQQLTGGYGAAAVLMMANSAKAYEAGLEFVAPYGAFVCVGIPPPEQKVRFHPLLGISKNIRIIGSAVGTRKDIWDAIDFVKRGVVTPRVEKAALDDLTEISKTFQKTPGKYVIRFHEEEKQVSNGH